MESSSSGSFATEFEKLLNERFESLRTGKIVDGSVLGINKDFVTIDIGFKSEGIIPVEQFEDSEGKLNVKIGDSVNVYILALENDYGQVVLSKEKADQKRVWAQVEDVFKVDGIVRGRVVQKVKGGLQVDIGIPAFLPGSQIDIRPHRNLDKFLGEEFDFKVLKVTRDKGNIVLSRRAVLMAERDELRHETLKVLQEGVVMEGIVKNVTDYGAFIDLGGIDGLLHISDITWGRIEHPSDKLTVGEKAPVVVLKYDKERERVSLGMKQLTQDPWSTVHEQYAVGARLTGKIVAFTENGAIVGLSDGIDGFIHNNDLSWTKKARHASKVLNEGETCECVILGIDEEQQKVQLGLKQLQENPWYDLLQRHPVGSKITGKVRSVTDFGIFVGIEDGIDGLVHVSDFSWTKRVKDPKEIQELYPKGADVEAVVLDVDAENERLSLGIKQLESDPWDTIVQRYPEGSKVRGKVSTITDFGVFVEIDNGVEGLIHNSELGISKNDSIEDKFKPGQELDTEVIRVDREERRISLSARAVRKREERDTMAEYMDESSSSAVTFGDLIREKIEKDS